ncbi:helix-turn-helix transcriptional regulator [Actinoplanes couchii]|uniref:Helix-turn-helix transcriptional regulator n=1 Tax=Actinoplanes couchii TaxID=403638 RepID=A0ABQ3WZS1_9ACTN|nr:helix-turn-helix transcriptional regulator [Actinoplanes couchii]MDR6316094.1 DNA-binding CsgD family transcriptional regulator [Actinoplanes couchii]GID51707.1 helix-turn-helix transcriptional regulator [Actinoplanes couchii]
MSAPVLSGLPLSGSAASQLLDRVAADPAAPLLAVVGAPGGYGKTVLLRHLADAYRGAGVPVDGPWPPRTLTAEHALLIDDAHRLSPEQLADLSEHASRPGARIVVAYRSWPRCPELLRLIEVLRRGGPSVVLPAFTIGQVATFLAAHLPAAPSAELTAFVTEQTAGIPRYVARMADALAHTPAAAPHVPVAALAPFAAELDELDLDVRTLLLAVEAGAGLSFDLVAAVLGEATDVADLVEAGRATGMLAADGTLVPLARRAIAALGPISQRIDVRQRLAARQLARGGPVLPLVRPLLRVVTGPGLVPGAAGSGLGPVYEAAGEEALGDDPALAAELFEAAAGAGRTTAARRALAVALAGDLDHASRLTDQVLSAGTPEQRAEAAYVAAAVLAHRGQTAQAVRLFEWAGSDVSAGFAAVGLAATGRLPEAERLIRADDPSAQPPTSLSAAATLMARGTAESVTGSPSTALSTLVQAATVIAPAGPTALLPDSPSAIGALLAMHCNELDVAESLLTRAGLQGTGGALLATRHHLLTSWVLLLRGRLDEVEQRLPATVGAAAPEGRDNLFGTALRVGLARRNGDLVGLRSAWPDACQALIGQPVELFNLLPLGELAVAAARLGEFHRVAGHLAEADRLLAELGDPPLWAVPLHWYRLQAAILADDRDTARRHADRLDAARASGAWATAYADAAAVWLDVLAGRADPEPVLAAARTLSLAGLTWDAARLAGQAAIRTSDRKAMALLLESARAMQGSGARPEQPATSAPARTTPAGPQLLSAREREVGALVLAGMTYKQIADRLYLSAKTVEHHMARIRQRLGCADRHELLTRLREIIGDPESNA